MPNTTKPNRYSDKELAEAHIYARETRLTVADEQDFRELRQKQVQGESAAQKLLTKIIQLKLQMQDYLGESVFDKGMNFGYFLKEYIHLLGKMNKEFAEEIDIKPTELSQLINNHRNPNKEILI